MRYNTQEDHNWITSYNMRSSSNNSNILGQRLTIVVSEKNDFFKSLFHLLYIYGMSLPLMQAQ
jgi:hypothetical protein